MHEQDKQLYKFIPQAKHDALVIINVLAIATLSAIQKIYPKLEAACCLGYFKMDT